MVNVSYLASLFVLVHFLHLVSVHVLHLVLVHFSHLILVHVSHLASHLVSLLSWLSPHNGAMSLVPGFFLAHCPLLRRRLVGFILLLKTFGINLKSFALDQNPLIIVREETYLRSP